VDWPGFLLGLFCNNFGPLVTVVLVTNQLANRPRRSHLRDGIHWLPLQVRQVSNTPFGHAFVLQ